MPRPTSVYSGQRELRYFAPRKQDIYDTHAQRRHVGRRRCVSCWICSLTPISEHLSKAMDAAAFVACCLPVATDVPAIRRLSLRAFCGAASGRRT